MSENKTTTRGFPLLPILTLIFITLKLTDHIDWSWVWVLSPMWIPFAVFFFVAAVLYIAFLLGRIFS